MQAPEAHETQVGDSTCFQGRAWDTVSPSPSLRASRLEVVSLVMPGEVGSSGEWVGETFLGDAAPPHAAHPHVHPGGGFGAGWPAVHLHQAWGHEGAIICHLRPSVWTLLGFYLLLVFSTELRLLI